MGKYKKYSRGTILLVDFGKNMGSEFNGKHFAIVLSKNDNEYSGKLSVIPLTSKDKRKRHVKINKSVINTIIQNAVNNALQKVYVYHQWYFLKKYIKNEKYMFGNFVLNYIHKRNALLIKIKEEELFKFFKEDTTALQEISKYYKKYNKFSFARVDSIRDIDKSRILPKVNHLDPIGDIILPQDYMKKISDAIYLNLV